MASKSSARFRQPGVLDKFGGHPPPAPVAAKGRGPWREPAPTGTGKTQGMRTGKSVYHATPLIALTDQKLLELQDTVARRGFERDRVRLGCVRSGVLWLDSCFQRVHCRDFLARIGGLAM